MTAAIDAQGISKDHGRRRAVVDVSLRVERGEKVGFLGPNGAGTTTFVRLVLGMLRPDAGASRSLRRRVREYSRGMKQKLALTAALQHDPPLVILDEPTGGLDPVVQLRLLDWLDGRARAGRTVFFSSHVLGEVESLCDRVAMVRDGRLLLVRGVRELGLGTMRTVQVRFAAEVAPDAYRVAGVGEVEVDGTVHRFTLDPWPGGPGDVRGPA